MNIFDLKDKSILFATFSMWAEGKRMPTNGNVEPFRDYLLSQKMAELILLDQPVPGSQYVMPIIEKYQKGSKEYLNLKSSFWLYIFWPLLKIFNKQGTRVIFKVRDFLSVLDVGLKVKHKLNYFVGIECINCLAGIVLRRLGRVDKVIYYVLDFSPNRYSYNLVNKIYTYLDKYCAMNSDYIWDVSREFQKLRLNNGLDSKKSAPLMHVPIGLYDYQIVKYKNNKTNGHNLVFVGTLGEENGPDLAIETLSVVLKKFPDTFLHIIGGGEINLKRLKKLAQNLGVTKQVRLYGFVASIKEMVNIISKFDISLAPYRKIPGSIRYYADSAKIRTYAGAGLPIVTTEVPPLGRELSKLGGALIAKDNETEMAKAVDLLFSNKVLYNDMQKKVMDFSRKNTWKNEFTKAFNAIN